MGIVQGLVSLNACRKLKHTLDQFMCKYTNFSILLIYMCMPAALYRVLLLNSFD